MKKNIENKKILCLFTSEFPFGNKETYIESEIPVLIDVFDRIFIFPSKNTGKLNRQLPEKFEIIHLNQDWVNAKSGLFLNNIFFIFKTLLKEYLFVSNKKIFFKNIREYKNTLLHKLYLARQLETALSEKNLNNSVLCSYWFSDWIITLGILKHKNKISSFFSRAHGFDIYDNRYAEGFIPFRYFQLKMVTRVFSVSLKGSEYLKDKKAFSEKISTSYLGVSDKGDNPFSEDGIFRMVSCSNVNFYKRIGLIVAILKNIDFPLNWVHFGDGELLDEIKNECKLLPPNITVEFKGMVPNNEILNYFGNNKVNIFITTSAVEGLPMTLIEASSFGIPLMGTEVGGIPEIINDQTGILIPETFDPIAVASLIKEFRIGDKNTLIFRKKVKNYWKENFESQKNYSEFYEKLIH